MPDKFRINIAKQIIEIEAMHNRSFAICRKFLTTNDDVNIKIKISQSDIDLERDNCVIFNGNCNYWDGYNETYALLRKIAEEIINYNTILMHGSAIATNPNSCYIFTAPSGVGKTTHTKLWLERVTESFVVNGDKPLLRIENNQVLACGNPWGGKENWYSNSIVPVKGICFIERAEHNAIKEISFNEAFLLLLNQVYRSKDEKKYKKTLSLLMELKNKVKFYKMSLNNFEEDAFETSYRMMVE